MPRPTPTKENSLGDASDTPDLDARLLLRPEEAARVLAIGRSKLYELLATGDLSSVRIGTARRITTAELRRYVAQLDRAPA